MANTTHGNFHPTALHAVNEALTVLGQDVILGAEDFSATSSVAHGRKAAYLYESARMRVMRDHAWNFARRETVVDCRAPERPFADRFPYHFPRPGGCARILSCLGADGRVVHHRLSGCEIHAESPVSRLLYLADIEDLDKWSPDAYRALVLRLAADLAKPVTGRINERQLQEQAYADMLAQAKLNDARECDVAYDAYGSNHFVEAMRGEDRPRPPFR